jgi:hypothetical protein
MSLGDLRIGSGVFAGSGALASPLSGLAPPLRSATINSVSVVAKSDFVRQWEREILNKSHLIHINNHTACHQYSR